MEENCLIFAKCPTPTQLNLTNFHNSYLFGNPHTSKVLKRALFGGNIR
jgi:hypothetical protein